MGTTENQITTFGQHLDARYGIRGTSSREAFERKARAFARKVIQEARRC